ncbi:hypothetical protein HPP92_013005 [Vanilla planifolia]|uniref:Small ribosomal subunit protein mS38 n=1 Tax=Vanilla planifolia TaxID=51239 RepID=A0A835V078_VANPL|nr:hypothetical protein HPP92_013005 [Vanilla planifolia]
MASHLHKLLRKSPPSFLTLASLNKIEFSQFFIQNPSLSSFPALLPNPSSSPQLSCFQEHNARVDAISLRFYPSFPHAFYLHSLSPPVLVQFDEEPDSTEDGGRTAVWADSVKKKRKRKMNKHKYRKLRKRLRRRT